MRARLGLLPWLVAAGCSVDDKLPAADAGIDPPGDAAPDEGVPSTTITAAPAAFSPIAAASFEFASDDPAAHFTCSVDGAPAEPCGSPFTRSLGDGPHGFAVRAIDAAGNADPTPAEHQWSIDTVAPETTLTSAPPAADNTVRPRFEFRASEPGASFECALDDAAYAACASGDEVGPLGDGTHVLAVRARDRAGNVDASPAIHAWTVDTSTPDTLIVSGPDGPTASSTATFAFVSPDAGGGATFQCALDGAAFTGCASPRTVSSLGEGPHQLAVRVRDAVGNVDPTPATRTWTVDLTAPQTAIDSGPSGAVAAASATFTFSASEPDASFACAVDGGAFAPCSSPHVLTGLAQGDHAFAVRATDLAGHTDATAATGAWTVDTIPPEVTITSGPPAGGTTGPRVVIAFTASEGELACRVDDAPAAPCASPLGRNLPAGPHELAITARDAAGNLGEAIVAWIVACGAPDATGAVGLLHLDDIGQSLANAVEGGAPATLGDDALAEVGDPASIAEGRFGRALAFDPADADHVAWPAALPAIAAPTIELWARPDLPAGSRELLATGDGRLAIRITPATATTLRFAAVVVEEGGGDKSRTVTSAAVAAGAWHHVVVSLAEPTLRLWVDGERADASNVSLGAPLAFDALRVGGPADAAYGGALDELWVSDAAITSDEAALDRYCPP